MDVAYVVKISSPELIWLSSLISESDADYSNISLSDDFIEFYSYNFFAGIL